MKLKIAAVLAALVLCSACTPLKKSETRVELPLELPESYKHLTVKSEAIEDSPELLGSKLFDSDELKELTQTALSHNLNLNAIKARIAQANARLKKANASLFPDLNFSLSGQKKRSRSQTASDSKAIDTNTHSWDTSLSSAYTLDIFGKNKAGRMAAETGLQATQADFESARSELRSQIAETWVEIIGVRSQKKLLEKQISVNENLVELLKFRYANGKANALDVSQQIGTLASTRALDPILEKQEKLLLNNLALLSGFTDFTGSGRQIKVETRRLPSMPSIPDIGVPHGLLEHRPDIKAAKMRLLSSKWAVKEAKANLLPKLIISANTAFSNGELDLLFKNWVGTLSAGITGNIFDGGLTRAELNRTRAAAQEQVNLYAGTVAQAIIEVENALVSLQTQNSYISLLEEELELGKLTLEDAMLQYQNGQSSYLSYLTAWTGVERLERQLVGERVTYIKKWIELCRALGWGLQFAPSLNLNQN
jgi:outer membrane protein, multidrug efflux system